MKTDLEKFMLERKIDAILVIGPADHNPAMVYLTGLGHMSKGYLIKKRGEKGTLFHISFECDEAAKSGLQLRSIDEFPYYRVLSAVDGDKTRVDAKRLALMLESCGLVNGNIMLYGQTDFGKAYSLIEMVKDYLPDIHFFADWDESILFKAMFTKDEHELDEIREMGKITTGVVARTADFLSGHKARDGRLIKPDGELLTIGEVKRRINLWLAEAGAENPEGTIFAIGRDAGVPHSSGNPDDHLWLGKTIVFDIFPCQAGGGYYYDFTRTWCLDYAPDVVLSLYDQVKSVYDHITSSLKVGDLASLYQTQTCELFERMGHPTIRSNKTTSEGYNHSISHGLGLRVHEKPWSGEQSDDTDRLVHGSVFTIEPGLYYPEKGIGVRIEDTFSINHKGQVEKMGNYPYDLIIPVQK